MLSAYDLDISVTYGASTSVYDKLSNGRDYKILTVIDEYTREALCVATKPKMGHAEVFYALYPLFLKHGRPHYIRSDNSSEFIARDLQA